MVDDHYWYHLINTLYGAWLYGDARGFRTRHHREHVEGDYKNPPPPGQYEEQARRSRASLKQPPVVLPVALRPVLGLAVKEKLEQFGAQVLCVAAGGQHLHVQAKLPAGQARPWMGVAKKHAWFVLRDHGWSGKLWGKRGREIRIKDRGHQVSVYHYILRHASEGAWVWTALREKK